MREIIKVICILCKNKAVAEYYLPKEQSESEESGWLPICELCAYSVRKYFKVIFHSKFKQKQFDCEHNDGIDTWVQTKELIGRRWECRLCGKKIKSLVKPIINRGNFKNSKG